MEASVARQIGRLDVMYDEEVDVLYLSIGEPRPAHSSEVRDGLLVDRDPVTAEVMGVTVLDYEQKFRRMLELSWVMDVRLPRDITTFLIERTPAH